MVKVHSPVPTYTHAPVPRRPSKGIVKGGPSRQKKRVNVLRHDLYMKYIHPADSSQIVVSPMHWVRTCLQDVSLNAKCVWTNNNDRVSLCYARFTPWD